MDELDAKLKADMADMLEELALTRAEFDFEADSILALMARKTGVTQEDAGERRT